MKLRRLVRFSELKGMGVHYSRRHLLRLEAERKFPRRVPFGTNAVGWVEDEIIQHNHNLIAARDKKEAARH